MGVRWERYAVGGCGEWNVALKLRHKRCAALLLLPCWCGQVLAVATHNHYKRILNSRRLSKKDNADGVRKGTAAGGERDGLVSVLGEQGEQGAYLAQTHLSHEEASG